MARIPLRSYHREIDDLIEHGQIDQAIAHCKHILKFFPKHIDSYRLLGKAYLESQRYSDASDILQRVLSSIPDDFIAHVGISMIREDEGNLDDAIWHMERAFEVQPANAAIQGELRRLYGRRDGVEPLKVRLTRGALARMYIKGELYPQSVAELRAALVEDPGRTDLLVQLARAYFLAGQKVEAAETCSTLLGKLPYCLDANHILAEVLTGSERSGEAQTYRERVQALDPYAAHLTPITPTAEQVPDTAVSVERLDWRPGQSNSGAPSQPEWAATLGVNVEGLADDKDSLPDWLAADHPTDAPFSNQNEENSIEQAGEDETHREVPAGDEAFPPPSGTVFAEPAEEDQIPDWMKDAGWKPSDSPAGEPEPAAFADEEEAPAEEISPAEIPDWLRSLAPAEALEEEGPQDQPAEDFLPWLSETTPGATDSVVNWLEGISPEQETAPAASELDGEPELPDWMASTPGADPQAELPDWLQNLEQSETAALETPPDAIPGWQVESEAGPAEVESTEAGLSWAEIDEPEGELHFQELAAGGSLDWVSEEERANAPEATSGESGEKEGSYLENEEAAFAWLEDLAAKQGASEGLLLSPEERQENLQDWLPEAEETEEQENPAEIEWIEREASTDVESPVLRAEEEGTPGWLAESAREVESRSQSEEPDWMVESAREIEARSQAEEPDWMVESAGEMEASPPVEAPDWINQGASEIEASPPAETPDWINQGASQIEASPPVETPDWINQGASEIEARSLAEEPAGLPEETPTAAEADIPEWLKTLDEEEFPGAQGAEIPSELSGEKELPDWLQNMEVESIGETGAEAALSTTDWLSLDEGPVNEEDTKPTRVAHAMEVPVPPEWASPSAFELDAIPEGIHEEAGEEADEEADEEAQSLDLLAGEEPDQLVESAFELQPAIEEAAEGAVEIFSSAPETPSVDEQTVEIGEAASDEEQLPEASLAAFEEAPREEQEAEQNLDDQDAAFAWLESLASRQGVEEGLLVSPEERPESPPDWILETPAQASSAEVEPLGEAILPAEDTDRLDSEQVETGGEAAIFETSILGGEVIFPQPDEAIIEAAAEGAEPSAEEIESSAAPTGPEPGEEIFSSEPEPVQVIEWWSEPSEEAEPEVEPGIEEPVTDEAAVTEPVLEPEPPETAPAEEVLPELPSWLQEIEGAQEGEKAEWTPPLEYPSGAVIFSQPVEDQSPAFKVNINLAGLAELERVPGIGFIRAQAILNHRRTYGSFARIEELLAVPGLDRETFEEIKDRVSLGEAPPAETPETTETSPQPAGEHEITLIHARNALIQDNRNEALRGYTALVKSRTLLKDVINDLHEALYRFPIDISIWQVLGDAYARNGQLQQALDTYTKAEELLR